jgi:hypothetical protein
VRKNSWSTLALIREACLNTFGWRSRGAASLWVAVAFGSGLAVYAALQWTTYQTALLALESQGAGTITFAAADNRVPVSVSRASCESLAGESGVVAAGIIADLGRSDFAQLGSSVAVLEASPSLVTELIAHDGVVGSSLVGTVVSREIYSPRFGAVSTATRSSLEGRLGIGSAVTFSLGASVTHAPSCTVVLKKYASVREVTPGLQSQLVTTGGAVIASERLRSPYPVTTEYLNRLERYLPILVGGVGAVMALIQYKVRGSELAAYRLSGTSKDDLTKLLTFEQILLAGTMAASGATTTYVLKSEFEFPHVAVLWLLLGSLAWIATFALACPVISRQNPISMAKER